MELPYVMIKSSPTTPDSQAHQRALDLWLKCAEPHLSGLQQEDVDEITRTVSSWIQLMLDKKKAAGRQMSISLRLPTFRAKFFLQNDA